MSAGKVLLWLFGALAFVGIGFGLMDLTPRIALLGLLGISAILVVLLPYHRSIQIFFLYLGIEGFAKLMSNYHPAVHVGSDLLVVALTARLAITTALAGGVRGPRATAWLKQTPRPPFIPLFVAHVIWFLMASANPYAISLMASLAGAKIYITMPALYFFGYYLITSEERVRQFLYPWIVTGALHIVFSIYQFSIGPSSVLGWAPGYASALEKFRGFAFRPFGLTHLPGGPSIYLYMISPFLLHLFILSRNPLLRLALTSLMMGSSIVLMLCQVRSAILKALVGFGGYFMVAMRSVATQDRSARKGLIGFAVIGSLLFVVALPRLLNQFATENAEADRAIARSLSLFDAQSVGKAREGGWERFARYAEMAPFGAGLSRTGAAGGKFMADAQDNPFFRNAFFTDNFWVAVVVDLGLPGCVLLTVIVFSILGRGALSLKRLGDPRLRAAQGAILCSLGSIVLGFYGAEAILYNPESAFFWFFAGGMMRLPSFEAPRLPEATS